MDKKFKGIVTFLTTKDASEEAAFDTEVYLNGDVANEVYKRYGVAIRIHIQSEE